MLCKLTSERAAAARSASAPPDLHACSPAALSACPCRLFVHPSRMGIDVTENGEGEDGPIGTETERRRRPAGGGEERVPSVEVKYFYGAEAYGKHLQITHQFTIVQSHDSSSSPRCQSRAPESLPLVSTRGLFKELHQHDWREVKTPLEEQKWNETSNASLTDGLLTTISFEEKWYWQGWSTQRETEAALSVI